MKKHWHSHKYKQRMLRHAKASNRRRLLFNDYLRDKNRSEQGIPRSRLKSLNSLKHQRLRYIQIWAPSNFSFVRNPEGMIEFIARLEECYDARQPVYVVLMDVTEIDYSAIAVLLSVMVRFKANRISFNGNTPLDHRAAAILAHSKFFKHLYQRFPDQDTYELESGSAILTHAMKVVDAPLGAKAIEKASQTVWGKARRCTGVQRALIELMHNTNNHASFDSKGERHWWLSIAHSARENKVDFSFVDYGVGVFRSLENKKPDSLFHGILTKLKTMFSTDKNADLLKAII